MSTGGLAEASIELEKIAGALKDRDQEILIEAAYGLH
jgi:hypothetical protein